MCAKKLFSGFIKIAIFLVCESVVLRRRKHLHWVAVVGGSEETIEQEPVHGIVFVCALWWLRLTGERPLGVGCGCNLEATEKKLTTVENPF